MDEKVDIRSVVERYTVLVQHGAEFLGHCPLHDDRHPSLRVNRDKEVWFCPVCNIGGDVFTFLEKVEGLNFQDALLHLGVEGPLRMSREDNAQEGKLR